MPTRLPSAGRVCGADDAPRSWPGCGAGSPPIGSRHRRSRLCRMLAELIERGGGRMLRGSSFYEDFVKTVLTINTSWSATCRMVAALVAEPGGGSFPGPAALLDYGEDRLRVARKARVPRAHADASDATDARRRSDHPIGRRLARAVGPRLPAQPLRHRPLCGGSLPRVAARFQPHPGRYLGRRLFARAIRLRRRPLSPPSDPHGAPISRSATGSSGCAKARTAGSGEIRMRHRAAGRSARFRDWQAPP